MNQVQKRSNISEFYEMVISFSDYTLSLIDSVSKVNEVIFEVMYTKSEIKMRYQLLRNKMTIPYM